MLFVGNMIGLLLPLLLFLILMILLFFIHGKVTKEKKNVKGNKDLTSEHKHDELFCLLVSHSVFFSCSTEKGGSTHIAIKSINVVQTYKHVAHYVFRPCIFA